MTVARTARRRRTQYVLGQKGLKQIYGSKAAPVYRKVDASKSARRLREMLDKMKKMAANKGQKR